MGTENLLYSRPQNMTEKKKTLEMKSYIRRLSLLFLRKEQLLNVHGMRHTHKQFIKQ